MPAKYVAIFYAIWNVVTFLMYGIDKLKAKKGGWRISEFTLIWCAFVMGGVGAFFGSKVFRHKTQKKKFQILLPTAFLFNIVVVACYICWEMGII